MRNNDSKALKLVDFVIDKAINGIPMLCSANELAQEYIADSSYSSNQHRANSLINWETSKNFTSGFVTSLGGALTLPINIAGSLAASWVIQARMSAAIAIMNNHNLKEDRVKTMILLTLLGDSCKEILKEFGIKLTSKITQQFIRKIPGKLLIEINKKVGFKLLTKAGEKGIINLAKVIPFFGGVVGGSVDAVSCRAVGYSAKQVFCS